MWRRLDQSVVLPAAGGSSQSVPHNRRWDPHVPHNRRWDPQSPVVVSVNESTFDVYNFHYIL